MPEFNILIVDDDFSLCEFTSLILAREGYCLHVAHDANQALKQVEQHAYDLIITDLTLPGLPGDQLARFLREQGHQCPIMLMTGSLLNAKPDHIDTVLLKPFSISELRKTVAALLNKQTFISRMAA